MNSMITNVRLAAMVLATTCLGISGSTYANDWPERPVRIVVPFGAGGGTDTQARLLSKLFYESLGRTFIVDNRPGAAGLIGAEHVAKAPVDGYTILFTTASLSVNVTLYRQTLTFDPVKDLAPVSWISSVPLVLIVHPAVPAKSVRELISIAKGGRNLTAGSNGVGTTSHLAVEMLKQAAALDVVNVPYKGGGPAVIALLSGEVDFEFATSLAASPHIKTGKVRALAVTTARPADAFPRLPTMGSLFPGFEVDNWYAMFVPAGTPKPIVDKLNAEILKALRSPGMQDFMVKEGAQAVGSSPQELAAMFKREVVKYARVIDRGHLASQ